MIARIGQSERTARIGQRERDSQNKTPRIGQPEQDRRSSTGSTGHKERTGAVEETCRMWQAEPSTQNVIGSKGQAGRDAQNGTEDRGRQTRAVRHRQAWRSSQKTTGRTWLPEQACLERIAETGLLGQTARTRQSGKHSPDMTARTAMTGGRGSMGQRNRTGKVRQAERDMQNRKGRLDQGRQIRPGQAELDRQTRICREGYCKQDLLLCCNEADFNFLRDSWDSNNIFLRKGILVRHTSHTTKFWIETSLSILFQCERTNCRLRAVGRSRTNPARIPTFSL